MRTELGEAARNVEQGVGGSDTPLRKNGVRFMISKMLSSRTALAALVVGAAMLSLMYYDTIQKSRSASSFLPMPHSAAISTILGMTIALGIISNLYVMELIMEGGVEARKAASKTLLSMVAGASGCASSIASVLLSLGIGVGSGALEFLSANMPSFFVLAFVMSLVSIKLAANTLAKVSGLVKF